MWRFVMGSVVVCWLGACNQFFHIPDVTLGDVTPYVGGSVHGLWDGTDGFITLKLHSGIVDDVTYVSANGTFRFEESLIPGTSYMVTVIGNPSQHTCVVDGGGEGMVAEADVTSVSIACTGPAVAITLSGLWGWAFDPTEEIQTFLGSSIVQDVALTVNGSGVSSASVDGTTVNLGEQTAPIALPLGSRMVPVALTASGGLSKTYQLIFNRGASVVDQIMYGKASNTGTNDNFGTSVSLSGDTLAVGAPGESSVATGVNGNQADNSAGGSGAVYVFVRSGTTWTQQAYLKASNTGANDHFGTSVSLSGDTLAVGAFGESSAATGVNGNQADNSAGGSGAVYVFVRSDTTWTQQAYLKASNTGTNDQFGASVSLSGDTLAVGADGESSAVTGVNGNQADNSAGGAGAAYVFVRSGTTWAQQAYLKASNTGANDYFGGSVSLSGDTLAVGARNEASAATGVNGDQADNSADRAGAVYVFVRSGTTWTQQAYIKASDTSANDYFGGSISLSADTLAVGGVSGSVYVFVRNGTTWSQQAGLGPNSIFGSGFGFSVSLSGDALAVGAIGAVDRAIASDRVFLFVRSGTTWFQGGYFTASNSELLDAFGFSVSLSGDMVAIGANAEDSAANGVNGNQTDNSAIDSGAIYVFR